MFARRADNQARAMAAIAVGEREEWAAPRRVKPVNRERRSRANANAKNLSNSMSTKVQTSPVEMPEQGVRLH